jgi:hypothetical protein
MKVTEQLHRLLRSSSERLTSGRWDYETVLDRFGRGIDVVKLAEQLRRDGAAPFVKSWKDLMICIESKAHAVHAKAGD